MSRALILSSLVASVALVAASCSSSPCESDPMSPACVGADTGTSGDGDPGDGDPGDGDPTGDGDGDPVAMGCGNGIVEAGEECDDGGESPTCDDDCTAARCGDQNPNAAAGEACDNDDNGDPNDQLGVDDVGCMANCTIPLFWDDSETGSKVDGWTDEVVSGAPNVESDWARTTRNAMGTQSWDSGIPTDNAGQPHDQGTGDTRLMTPAIDLSGLEGETIELRINHAYKFSDCSSLDQAPEGGRVEVSVDGGPFEALTPDDDYPGTIGAGVVTPNVNCPNPLFGEQAFILDSGWAAETFDLSAYAGSTIVIGFHASWDCANCSDMNAQDYQDQSDRGWFVDDVVVWTKGP